MNKNELLKEIREERGNLESAISNITHDQMFVVGVHDIWSTKDLLGHISMWEHRLTNWLRVSKMAQEPKMLPEGMTWDRLDDWNRQSYLELKERNLEEVQAQFRSTYPEVFEVIESLSEDDLFEEGRFAWRKGRPLWRLVAANTSWHYKEHSADLAEWLKNQ